MNLADPPAATGEARRRRLAIQTLVERHRELRVSELAAYFGVSEVTIRKDLTALAEERRILRIRGAARSRRIRHPEPVFEERELRHRPEKAAIGRLAASLIVDGDIVAFDASTTAFQVAMVVGARGDWRHLVVLTNGLRAAAMLSGTPGIEVHLPRGRVRAESLSVVQPSHLAVGSLPRRIDKAVLGAAGYTFDAGLTESTAPEAAVKASIVARTDLVIAALDHTKWGRIAAAPFCSSERIGLLVTDAGAPLDMLASLVAHHTPYRLASLRGDG